MPDSVYSRTHFNNDYSDDFQSRGYWVNYLSGGSKVLPGKEGLHIPVDLALAFHTDAGYTPNDSIIGTLGIFMTHHNNEVFENGQSRWASRDLTSLVMDQIVSDIRAGFEPKWTRRAMQKPEELQNYFVHRLNKIIDGLGKRMAGWDEILDGGDLEGSIQVYAWRSLKRAELATEKRVPTVVMVGQNYYFDMAQSKYERGHNWAGLVPLDKVYALDPADKTVFTPEQAKQVVGVQAAIWSELFNEPARFLDYQSYPRICAMCRRLCLHFYSENQVYKRYHSKRRLCRQCRCCLWSR